MQYQIQPQRQQQGITLNLESTGALLGILISACALATIIIRLVTQFNNIVNKLKDIEEDLIKHVASQGHDKLEPKLLKIDELDKKLELHIQEVLNRKEAVNMLVSQLDEKINYRFSHLQHSIKDMEGFLNKQGNFRIRQYHEEE